MRGVRPGGGRARRGAPCPASSCGADRLRRRDGRRRGGAAHRVGRVPVARLRPGQPASMRRPRDRRRTQPARPGRDAPPRLRLHRSRASLMSGRNDGNCRRRGGAGFIGSHLCDALLARGDEVVAVDNLSTGRVENIEHLPDQPGFSVRARRRLATSSRSTVVSTACCTSPARRARPSTSPRRSRRSTSAASGRAAPSTSRGRNDARFLVASTSEVYGDPEVHPQPETYHGNVDPNGPRAVYDEAKRFAETLTVDLPPRCTACSTAIVRIFNTYGPRLRPADGRVVSNFLVQALDGKPLTIYGTGTQTRSFCYVDDEVAGHPRAVRLRRRRSGQHRQPDRVHDAGARRSRARGHRLELRDRVRAAARAAIRHAADPTSLGRARCSAGSRRSSCATVSARTRDWYLEERAHGRA